MSKLANALVELVGTDTSGKWINVEKVDEIVSILIHECVDQLMAQGYSDAGVRLMQQFYIKRNSYDTTNLFSVK